MMLNENEKQEIRNIIRDELSNILKIDRYVFDKKIQILDARNIQLGRTTGTKIGTEGGATGQKLGFYGKTPITQQVAISAGTVKDLEVRAFLTLIGLTQ